MRVVGLVLVALLGAGSAQAQEPAELVSLARALSIRLADRIGASFIVRGEGALTDAVRNALGDRLAPVGASLACLGQLPAGGGGTHAITVHLRLFDADSAIVSVDYSCYPRTPNRRRAGYSMTEDVLFQRGASGWVFVRRDMTRIS